MPKLTKAKLGGIYLLIFSIILCVVIVYFFSLLKINISEYTKYLVNTTTTLLNKDLAQLINANTLSNLPNINISTNNADLNEMISCSDSLKYLGPINTSDENYKAYRNLCKNTCGGNGELIIIKEGQEYIFENTFLDPGVYCTINPPICNMNTGYVVATINSTICKSKYPSMFSGPTASHIIACNNEKYAATGSVLWDYANNEAVDPITVVMTHENETLPDGSYRFRCKFAETSNGNPYIPHPLNRFHPLVDACNKTIVRASYDVHANVQENSWTCECGDYDITRVKHLDPGNLKSTCTSCFHSIVNDNENSSVKVPYLCFNTNSLYSAPKTMQPCLEFNTNGNNCDSLTLRMHTKYADVNPDNSTEIGTSNMPYLNIDIPDNIDNTLSTYWANLDY